jgi:hypothetical protein
MAGLMPHSLRKQRTEAAAAAAAALAKRLGGEQKFPYKSIHIRKTF